MTATLQALGLAAAIAVFLLSEPHLNRMERGCRIAVRVAFWLLVVGSAGVVLMITQGYAPNIPSVLVLTGTALLLYGNKRRPNDPRTT